MIAKPIAVIRDVDNDCVFIETLFHQGVHNATNLMIYKADLAIGIRDDLAQLLVRLRLNAGIVFTNV